jgi:translation initiation factor 2D
MFVAISTINLQRFHPVYTLWERAILPIIYTPTSVVPRLLEGADLMIPGIIFGENEDLPAIPQHGLVSIAQRHGNIVAVGKMALDSQEIKAAAKGKAVVVIHTYKDALWRMGSKSDPKPSVPLSVEEQTEPHEAANESAPGSPDASSPVVEGSAMEPATPSTPEVSTQGEHILEPSRIIHQRQCFRRGGCYSSNSPSSSHYDGLG